MASPAAACRRIGVADDGRPYCAHGPMWKRNSSYRCRESCRRYVTSAKGRETERRYEHSTKGRERSRRYNHTPHAQLNKQIHELTRIRTRL